MEAMILAAGGGTRLRPLTDTMPKALLRVRGRPLLAHVIERLVAAGVTRLVVNVHHHADQIETYLRDHAPPGVEVALSPEPGGPYDTGGGLLAAAPLFRRERTFVLHNVDVLSAIPLDRMLAAHTDARARSGGRLMATVAVQARATSRQLLCDDGGLIGWERRGADGAVLGAERVRNPVGELRAWAFTGIHAVEPAIFGTAERAGRFSIIAWYLDLARRGHTVLPFDASAYQWMDVGTPARLADAEREGPGGALTETR